MAHVAISYEAFANGNLPPVCCKTGEPTDILVNIRFSYAPSWTWILFFFGILPWVLARVFASVRVEGDLPFSAEAERRLVLSRRTAIVAMVLLIPFAALAFSGPAGAVLIIADVAVAAVAYALNFVWSPGIIPDDHHAVELTRVHPRFVDAVRGHLVPGV